MDWFKTKENTETTPTEVDESILPLVRTMADDLAGREVPTKIIPKAEPLVGFDPKAATGAAFYAAPGVVTAETVGSSPETSPFFQTAEEKSEADSAPAPRPATSVMSEKSESAVRMAPSPLSGEVSAPPEGLPVVPEKPASLQGVSINEPVPVTLNVSQKASGASFEGVLPTKGQALGQLKSVFSRENIKWIGLAAVGILLVVIGGGVYFWKMNQSKAEIPSDLSNAPLNPNDNKPVEPETVPQKQYQSDQPNILSFDTETVTPAEIKAALLQAGQGIKKDGLTGAVEFIVRDQKLNPLALSRFAYLAKMELPSTLLEILDESFSVYIYIDQGRPRAVLLAYAKDQELLALELQKNEKALPAAIEPLFLDMTTAPKNNLVFRDGSYLERPVRFTNVDTALGLSVDYAVRGKQWIIGTSKDSLRSVLDKTGL